MSNGISSTVLPLRLLRGVTRTITLTIYAGDGETPVDLTEAEVRVVVLRDGTCDTYEPTIQISGAHHNEVSFTWPASRQHCGRHTIDIVGDFGETGVSRTNWHGPNGIELVEWSELASMPEVPSLDVSPVDLIGEMEVAPSAGSGRGTPSRVLVSSKTSVPPETSSLSKADMASTLGISEADIDALMAGSYTTIVFGNIVGTILSVAGGKCEVAVNHKVYALYGGGNYRWATFGIDLLYAEDRTKKVDTITTLLDNRYYPSVPGVYGFVKPTVASAQPAAGLKPGVLYRLGELEGNEEITLATPDDANVENEYKLTFDTGSTVPDITWPTGITWAGNCLSDGAPAPHANKHYEVSIEDGIGLILEV